MPRAARMPNGCSSISPHSATAPATRCRVAAQLSVGHGSYQAWIPHEQSCAGAGSAWSARSARQTAACTPRSQRSSTYGEYRASSPRCQRR